MTVGDNHHTLEKIEGDSWAKPPSDATRLMVTVHNLRRKPIGQMSVEDMRILINQRVGIKTLVPRALTILEQDPFVQGDFYPGDLLAAVLRIPDAQWVENSGWIAELRLVIREFEHAKELHPKLPRDYPGWIRIEELRSIGLLDF